MSGIIFTTTSNLPEILKFYLDIIGCEKWVSQPDVEIIKHENFLIGLHQTNVVDKGGLFTFFYETKEDVDQMYSKLDKMNLTKTQPKENTKYNIYNFFAEDPEGRKLEFQVFLHDLPNIC